MMKNIFLACFGILFTFLVNGQQLNFTNFSVSEGLAQSQVYSMLETDGGELIIATQGGGVSVFDGKNFTTISKNNGLLSNNVNILYPYRDSILIGTDKGLSVYFNKQIIRSLPLVAQVSSIHKKGTAYLIGTTNGVFLLKEGKTYQQKNVQLYHKKVTGFFSDSLNQYWVTTTEGVYNLSNPFKRITTTQGLPTNVIACVTESDDYIYLGTEGHGVVTLNKGLQVIADKSFNRKLSVSSLLIDSQNKIWVGTQNQGVFRINKKQIDHYTLNEGLPSNYVKSFHEDHWGNIWIGSFGGGLSRFTETQFVHFDNYSGLSSDYILHLVAIKENKVWASTGTGGISLIGPNRIHNLTKDDQGRTLNRIPVFDIDKNENAWVFEEEKGLAYISFYNGRFGFQRINTDYKLSKINDVKIYNNDIYVATQDKGILKAKLSGSKRSLRFERIELLFDNTGQNILLLQFDPQGNLWFVDERKGLAKLSRNELLYIDNTIDLDIRSITFNKTTPVLGTSNGLYTIEGTHLLKWKNNQRLSSENIYQVAVDKDLNLWVGSEQGLDKISTFFGAPNFQHYGPREGFQGLETTRNAVDVDPNGNLWFGTVKGIEKYAKKSYVRKKIAPLLSVQDIRIGYVPIEQTEYFYFVKDGLQETDSLILPFDKKPIEIELKALDLSTAQGANFTHFLEGYDEMWAPITKRNTILFNNLPPGDYILRYKTGNSQAWTPVRSIRLIITPPFYSAWWFVLLVVLGIIGFIYLIFRIALERLRKNNAALKEKLEMERNLVELEQKALRLQMNPHFVFNVLQSIQEQIIKDDKNKARLVIAKFAKLMRSILENSREKYISIEEELNTVEHYMKLEQLIKSLDFTYDIEVDDELDVNEEIIPPLLIQPFIENAIIHGFKHIKRAPHIAIKVMLETDNNILITIDDNGCGRQKSQSTKSQVDHLHKSLALQVTQERLSILDQSKNDKPLFAIIDKEENGEAMGTRIELRIGI
ncbi:Two component regulator propeller [Lishizhenia tianjinensis]|uniref:Two component regulator propeller n=1 Tax=Lishizhenia tianjinensis TaxID=477690 RepID=A0A1I7BPJ7_9FLAO|nr:two-component regulator propeller domain-containing protein [Lishizhenia tianjinensis]SFT89092.1 Two component regulator propeller [Lishizhenia tianjinensis]